MPHVHRFYIVPESAHSDVVELTGPEAHHGLHVVRLRAGDQVDLFDGRGNVWDARVVSLHRHTVRVQLEEHRYGPPRDTRLTLFQAWLHRDKAIEELVCRGTEVGIARFVFFPAHHSERRPRASDKWVRTAIEACKQCRRAWLPDFAIAVSFEDALAMAGDSLFVATHELPAQALENALVSSETALFVGPEGDFTEQELGEFVARDATVISLGSATYRSEVAAVLASTLLLYERGEMGPR